MYCGLIRVELFCRQVLRFLHHPHHVDNRHVDCSRRQGKRFLWGSPTDDRGSPDCGDDEGSRK
jgi:hypothetical protein